MSTNSAHDFLAWLDNFLFGHRQPTDSGWQRTSAPDTGSHQFPDAFKGVNVLEGIVGGPPWNGPDGTWLSVYRGELPHRRRGDTPIPPVQETGSIRPIQRTDSIRRIARTGRLVPIDYDPLLPVKRQQTANNAALDDMIATSFVDLPTWIAPETTDRRIKELLARSEPLADNSWLTADPYSALKPPVLQEMDEDATASADKISNPLGVTMADMQPDLSVSEPTELSRKVRDQRAIEQLLNETKESE